MQTTPDGSSANSGWIINKEKRISVPIVTVVKDTGRVDGGVGDSLTISLIIVSLS